MNVLLTDDGLDWTGRQQRLLQTAQALLGQGCGLAIVCSSHATLREKAVAAGVQVLDLDFIKRGRFEAARRLRTLERRAKVDLIHIHGRRDASAALPLHLTGTPIVRDCDDAAAFPTFGLLRAGCRRVIATCAEVSEALIARGLKSSRINTLRDGDDPERGAEALLSIYMRAIAT